MVLDPKRIDWDKLKSEILGQEHFIDKYGDCCKEISLGRLPHINPSGKYYARFGRPGRDSVSPGSYGPYMKFEKWPPTENIITREEMQKDYEWMTSLKQQAEKHGLYVRPSDNDDRDIRVGMIVKRRWES